MPFEESSLVRREALKLQVWQMFGLFVGIIFGISLGLISRLIVPLGSVEIVFVALAVGLLAGIFFGSVVLHPAVQGGLPSFCIAVGLTLSSGYGFFFGFCLALGALLGVGIGFGIASPKK